MAAHIARRGTLFIVALLLILVPLTPASAQVDKGIIEVVASDESGAALPGVTVTVRRADTGFQNVATTGDGGVVRFPALTPGDYQVSIELSGFATIDQSVPLRVGQTRRLDVVLKPQSSETITVTGEAGVVDLHKVDSSTNIVPEQIEDLPVPDRDFQRLAFIAPGVQRERGGFRFIGGGPVVGSGGNASQATILVDGVNFTDQALGLSRARFSQDAIREFRVITNRFDTEIGGSSGGALSIVTKSGTNDLGGTIFGFFRDDALREAGALEQDELPYQREQYGFTLGGPIVQDKSHFFLSLERVDEENVSLFRPGGAFGSQAADVEHPFEQLLGFAGIDHIINEKQNVAGKLVYETYREDNFRVGGIADISYGQELNRDNWNVTLSHGWTLSSNRLNDFRAQYGSRKYDEPTNSDAVAEWFSSGTTLQTGGNILGDLLGEGDQWEIRDTFRFAWGSRHNFKTGFSVQQIDERSRIDVYETGLFIYVTDTRALPLAYAYGTGSADVRADTTLYGAFIEDEWRPLNNLTLNVGVRYDLDTDGNNPDFEHPLVPEGRDVDRDNIQPRLGFSWDVKGDGKFVVRGGSGLFTGKYLLVPVFTELQQNGVTGRILTTRLNGALLGIPALALDPTRPTTTGIALPPDIGLLAEELDAPESVQTTLGFTTPIFNTGLFFDMEGIYAEGHNEIVIRDVNFGGNANPVRLNRAYNQINVYTNEGDSKYQALVLSVNGTLRGGHIITSSLTFADKKNTGDDFSPDFPFGYPNDPSRIESEFGRSRADEHYRAVISGVFRAPWGFTVAPIFEYGSGQPWTKRLGYDFNGDGKNSDRPAGVGRNAENGPSFNQFNLRLTKNFALPQFGGMDLIVEAFNLFDETNYDVNSINSAVYLSGPTLANPTLAYRPNPNFGAYRATLPGREIQLGVRWGF